MGRSGTDGGDVNADEFVCCPSSMSSKTAVGRTAGSGGAVRYMLGLGEGAKRERSWTGIYHWPWRTKSWRRPRIDGIYG